MTLMWSLNIPFAQCKWACEFDLALSWEWRLWSVCFAPFDRWQWGRSENLFGNPEWSFGPLLVTHLMDSI